MRVRHVEILNFTVATETAGSVAGDISDDSGILGCNEADPRLQRLLWMMLAVEIGGHSRIRRADLGITEAAFLHRSDVCARRFPENH